MATEITPLDLKSSDYGGMNLTDETLDAIVAATAVQFNFQDADFIYIFNNEASLSRTFNVTLPIPSPSVLSQVAPTMPTKDYVVAAQKGYLVALSEAFRDPSTQKVIVDCTGANCQIKAYKV